jgi:hypothetical protein
LGFGLPSVITFDIGCASTQPVNFTQDGQVKGDLALNGNYKLFVAESQTHADVHLRPIVVSQIPQVTSNNPGNLTINIIHKSPVNLADPINFKSCSATINGEACLACDICDAGQGVLMNCANVLISDSGSGAYYFPTFQCISFANH